ncbi:hypothetical protein AMK26_01490 [Streptomyces sp. CB03234]|nr:hypothetical protein AMK26_01490 [Streptomyces sp. CB03234]
MYVATIQRAVHRRGKPPRSNVLARKRPPRAWAAARFAALPSSGAAGPLSGSSDQAHMTYSSATTRYTTPSRCSTPTNRRCSRISDRNGYAHRNMPIAYSRPALRTMRGR